jgi:hypothetical protein
MEFKKIIESNLKENTFILYGYNDDIHWLDFVIACNEYNKDAVLLTPKSAEPKPYTHKPYPHILKKALSYPNVFHWEVSSMSMEDVLNNKAKIYKKQYGGIITNHLLLRGNGKQDGYKVKNISGDFWD